LLDHTIVTSAEFNQTVKWKTRCHTVWTVPKFN